MEALAELAGGPHRTHRWMQLGGADEHECDDHRQVARGVEDEALADAEGGDHDAADRRPDRPCRIDDHAVQRDRIGDVTRAHHLHHERLAARVVDGGHRPEPCGDGIHHPEFDHTREGENAEGEREHSGERLREHDQLALLEAVGDHPSVGSEQQCRQELHRHHRAERGAAAGEFEHEPSLREALHPRAGERDDLAEEVQAVVAKAQRRKGAARQSGDPLVHESATRRSSSAGSAAIRVSMSSAPSSASCPASQVRPAVRAWSR